MNYLVTNNKIEAVKNVKSDHLHIISDNVLEMIHNDTEGWEDMVPHKVASEIKIKGLFKYALNLMKKEKV